MNDIVKVFICHSSLDKPFATRLAYDLCSRGISVWLDKSILRVGDSLFESIQSGLKSSDFVIVVMSDGAMQRPWVRREVAAAFNLELDSERKRILPVLVEECEIPLLLKDKLYADFRTSYDVGFESLLGALDLRALASSPTALFAETGDVILRIEVEDGSLAEYEKRVRSVCEVDYVEDLVESFTSDGKIINLSSSAGDITDVWTESSVTYYRTVLHTPLKKGDVLERVVRLTMKDAFLGNPEYWEGKQFSAAKHYGLTVVFPARRSPTRWSVEERDAIRTIESQHVATRANDEARTTLVLSIDRPTLYRTYILRWWW